VSTVASAVYEFPEGLPAFESETRFRLAEPEGIRPLSLLESLTTPGLRFVCVPIEILDSDYRLELGEEERALLQLSARSQGLRLFAIVAFPAGGPPIANLRAPLALNPAAGVGAQVVQTDDRYPLARALRPEAGGPPRCS
jgi:flagellar assembly factor FliW